MRDLGTDVEHVLAPVERVEVLGERLPLPLDALGERGAGDVLDAFHQLDQPFVPVGRRRSEADAAVAHDAVVTPCHDDGVRYGSHVACAS